jgi:hypothetical protein
VKKTESSASLAPPTGRGRCEKIAERQQGGNSPLRKGLRQRRRGCHERRKTKMLMALGIVLPLCPRLPVFVRQPPDGFAVAPFVKGEFFHSSRSWGCGGHQSALDRLQLVVTLPTPGLSRAEARRPRRDYVFYPARRCSAQPPASGIRLFLNQEPVKLSSRDFHFPGYYLHGFRLHHSKALCHLHHSLPQCRNIQRCQRA